MNPGNTVDSVIVGGGIAGLWLANLLGQKGYRLLLLEADDAGGEQTLASQGMIHGGLKYSLAGTLTRATLAITGMPARWRAHLAGEADIDLRALTPLCDRYYLFGEDAPLARLSSFLASKLVRGPVRKLARSEYPAAFADPAFRGVVYAVEDLVIDTAALVRLLHQNVADRVFRHRLAASEVAIADDQVRLTVGRTEIRTRHLILCAGSGNGPLLTGLTMPAPRMQLRPLQQALVYHDYPHPMFAHCITDPRRTEPRLTITTHQAARGTMWYLGGQLATDGADLSAEELAKRALDELRSCVSWIPWDAAHVETLRIDRAEPLNPRGARPDEAFAEAHGPVVVCWPTKLALTPDLGDRVQPLLDPPCATGPWSPERLGLPLAALRHAPWDA